MERESLRITIAPNPAHIQVIYLEELTNEHHKKEYKQIEGVVKMDMIFGEIRWSNYLIFSPPSNLNYPSEAQLDEIFLKNSVYMKDHESVFILVIFGVSDTNERNVIRTRYNNALKKIGNTSQKSLFCIF